MTLIAEVEHRLAQIPGLTVLHGAELKDHTRFHLGGRCWLLADAATESAFLAGYDILNWSHLRWTSIGGGTNLVVSDDGYPGAILRFSGDRIRTTAEPYILEVDAGAELNDLIDFANGEGFAGMESMAGIPGWVGAAIYGNAGAYGQSIDQRILSVRFFDGATVRDFSRAECGFRYRHSIFKENKAWQILSARLLFEPGDSAALSARSAATRATRDAKFPPSMRCAGSIFKNLIHAALPEPTRSRVPDTATLGGKVPAGWFLEQVGAKGLRRGDIQVADYHANLVFNHGEGKAADLVALLEELKMRVEETFGFQLEEEVQYLGFDVDWLLKPEYRVGYGLAIASLFPGDQLPTIRNDKGWTPADVLRHLIGNERDSARPRLEGALTQELPSFPAYDASTHPAPESSFPLQEFVNERMLTAQLLRLIPAGMGDRAIVHTDRGVLTIRQLVKDILVHDLNHLAQLARMLEQVYS